MRIVVILFIVLITLSLGSALFSLLRRQGDRRRTANALAIRVGLSITLFVLLMAGFASGLGYRPEAFLMAVAIGAGCDFLTPIGHQCNTLVMGPGGYRFSDYPRLGLPLSILVIIVAVPALLVVWPLQ